MDEPARIGVTGALYDCRPDFVGFVDRVPLVVIKLEKAAAPAPAAFDEDLT